MELLIGLGIVAVAGGIVAALQLRYRSLLMVCCAVSLLGSFLYFGYSVVDVLGGLRRPPEQNDPPYHHQTIVPSHSWLKPVSRAPVRTKH
jgi:hypothetical protein